MWGLEWTDANGVHHYRGGSEGSVKRWLAHFEAQGITAHVRRPSGALV
jgi:hypothetical protein